MPSVFTLRLFCFYYFNLIFSLYYVFKMILSGLLLISTLIMMNVLIINKHYTIYLIQYIAHKLHHNDLYPQIHYIHIKVKIRTAVYDPIPGSYCTLTERYYKKTPAPLNMNNANLAPHSIL